ncbi:hypothetical protein [Microbacterium sp. RURRCA19A]|uniref:DUF3846 domain-containing protein n=1 Tax=Microbacterium sp. RURRCA19A TaxID=1907391 RepID=UPI000956B0F3|nr:hypothetical protein [Microbacterium sp. RURRCA19A]SIS17692.1 hypothetical protein SAMN05880568_3282 [Microbacterium sp. RURRCA19A]
MVRSIVIPHDIRRPARVCELPDLGAFQTAVDGNLEPLEIPTLDVTVYMNEGARREHQPLNVRASALWWYCSAVPTEYPLILGDVVLSGNGQHFDEDGGDVPVLVERFLGTSSILVQATRRGDQRTWLDTMARFDNVFDAAVWCSLFRATMGGASRFRIVGETSGTDLLAGLRASGGELLW